MAGHRVSGLLPSRRESGIHEQELLQQNPKNSEFGRRISCGGAFLETRPKNKDALACKRDATLIGSMVAVNASICLQAMMEF
jgi:hypothetical protein